MDYSSSLTEEDKVLRFSEKLEDLELSESLRLEKLYRKIQRQVHCGSLETGVRKNLNNNVRKCKLKGLTLKENAMIQYFLTCY